MSTYLKAFITLIILIYVQGCSTDNKENLVLDAEGGQLNDIDSSPTEIEVEENILSSGREKYGLLLLGPG